MTDGTLATDSTRVRIGIFTLVRMAASRLIRFPVATLIGLALSTLLGWLLSLAPAVSVVATSGLLLAGVITSIALVMGLVMFQVMDGDELPDLGRVVRALFGFAVVFGTAVIVPLIAAAYFVPDAAWEHFVVGWLPNQAPFLFASLGPVLLFGMMPAMLVAWPIVARHDTGLWSSVGYVWQWIENQRYSAVEITIGVAGVCAMMCFVPYLSILVTPFLASLAVVTFDAVSDDIVVADEQG